LTAPILRRPGFGKQRDEIARFFHRLQPGGGWGGGQEMLEFFLATAQFRLIRRDLAASPADVGRPLV